MRIDKSIFHNYYVVSGIVFKLLVLMICTNATYHHDGYITPDSEGYLSAVVTVDSETPFYVKNNVELGNTEKRFSIWPMGYPIAVWLVSKIGISTFWASKVLNVLILLFFLIVLRKRFKDQASLFVPLFLLGSSVSLFSSTLTEPIFTFLLFLYTICLQRIVVFHKRKTSEFLILVFITLAIPLIRHAGIVIFFMTSGIMVFHLVKRNFKIVKFLFFNLLVSSLIYGIYLIFNFLNTSAPKSDVRSLIWSFDAKGFVKTVFGEFIFIYPGFSYKALALQTIVILAFIFLFKMKFKLSRIKNSIFVYVGICYILGTILLLNLTGIIIIYRYFYPGTFLIFIALISSIDFNKQKNNFISLALALGVTSIAYNAVILYKSKQRRPINYHQNIRQLKEKFEPIKSGDIILNPPKHLKYIRPDVLILDSWYYSKIGIKDLEKEVISAYPNHNIFMLNEKDELIKIVF